MSAVATASRTRLRVLTSPRARKLHVADPSGQRQALCGKEDGDAAARGFLDEHKREHICKACLGSADAVIVRYVPDPETGEVIEEVLPPDAFKPEADAGPVTRDFTTKVLAGERPGLVFPGKEDCPLENGQEIELTSNVSIVVNRITKTKGGDHRCRYSVRDFRETLIRRTPPSAEPPETDSEGFPIPHTKEAIAAATIDGNYTQDPRQAIPAGAPEVDVEYRRVLGVRKRKADMESESETEARRKRERALRDELRATLKGLEPQAQAELLARIESLCEEARNASVGVV